MKPVKWRSTTDMQKIARMLHDVIPNTCNLANSSHPRVGISGIVAHDHHLHTLLSTTQWCLEVLYDSGFSFQTLSWPLQSLNVSFTRLLRASGQVLCAVSGLRVVHCQISCKHGQAFVLFPVFTAQQRRHKQSFSCARFQSFTTRQRVHCLGLLGRQSKFAHDGFCTSRITLSVNSRTILEMNDATRQVN